MEKGRSGGCARLDAVIEWRQLRDAGKGIMMGLHPESGALQGVGTDGISDVGWRVRCVVPTPAGAIRLGGRGFLQTRKAT